MDGQKKAVTFYWLIIYNLSSIGIMSFHLELWPKLCVAKTVESFSMLLQAFLLVACCIVVLSNPHPHHYTLWWGLPKTPRIMGKHLKKCRKTSEHFHGKKMWKPYETTGKMVWSLKFHIWQVGNVICMGQGHFSWVLVKLECWESRLCK